jgi:sarcosine oxidase
MSTIDTIVVGLGAMGSAAAYQLSSRGQRILGLEAFDRGHQQGSSHGESRIIRLAYYEHPDYVPLLRRAYELWHALEAESGEHLLRMTGGLMIGPPDGALVGGAATSARLHGLEHEMLDAADVRRRYPALQVDASEVALWEPQAGILSPERCIGTHLRLAEQHGATLHFQEPLRSWTASGDSVTVVTDRGSYEAEHVVFACGAWIARVLPDLQLPVQAERIPLFWMQPAAHPEWFSLDALPIYLWELEAGGAHFYGFPHLEWQGVKVARHHSGEACDPDAVDRSPHPRDEELLRDVLRRCIPALNGEVVHRLVCMYENTPDLMFLIDRHPQHSRVIFAGGFSGHGFKFSSVVGEILADHVTRGRATPNAEFLRLDRQTPGQGAQPAHR